jgi:hypothetical protein
MAASTREKMMTVPVLIVLVTLVVVFFVSPQLAKFRATLGISQNLASGTLTILQKISMRALGLKTPFLNTLAFAWTFIATEGDNLRGFAWESIVSHEHAAWIAFGLWAAGIWSHFQGLNAAAAAVPMDAGMPVAIPPAPIAPAPATLPKV